MTEAPGPEIWAYHAYWMGEAWRSYDLAAFRRILFFDLVAAADGGIEDRHGWPGQWSELRRRADEARVPVDPVVSVFGKATFSALFSNPQARARLAAELVGLAREAGGLHLDVEVFESVGEAELGAFRSFLAELRTALDLPPRKVLTAFVTGGGDLYGMKELGLLDAVVLQGYDVHWREGPNAGPVALLQAESRAAWRPAAEALARQGVPPGKIVFSTPLYGYEWPTVSGDPRAATRGAGAIITYAPVPSSQLPDIRTNALTRSAEHGLRREAGTGAPWYAFRDGEGWRQGWFDDAASLRPRLDFAARGGYRGVALFVLGYDGGALLEAIQAGIRGEIESAGASRRPAAR